MRHAKEKRRGGARDESEIYISYSREQLCRMIAGIHRRCLPFLKFYERNQTPYGAARAALVKKQMADVPVMQWRRYK